MLYFHVKEAHQLPAASGHRAASGSALSGLRNLHCSQTLRGALQRTAGMAFDAPVHLQLAAAVDDESAVGVVLELLQAVSREQAAQLVCQGYAMAPLG